MSRGAAEPEGEGRPAPAAAPVDPAGAGAPPAPRRLRGALAIVVLWLLVGLFNGSADYLRSGRLDDPRTLAGHLADVLLWAGFTPFIFLACRRFPLERGRWPRSLPAHALGGTLVAVAGGTFNYFVQESLHGTDATLPAYVLDVFHFNFGWYWIIVALGHAVVYYGTLRDRELHASRLETQLARAQLEALKTQIQPHFLFNTLNAISELVHEDVELAEETILRLASLLRMSVDSARTQEVALQQELELLDAYLAIQQTRFRDRLLVYVNVAPDALDAMVPHFVLQPLVENALRHGAPADRDLHRIVVTAEVQGDRLVLEIRDNGPGFGPDPSGLRLGVGLGNVRARLGQLYGRAGAITFGDAEGGGGEVRLTLPVRRAHPAADGGPAAGGVRSERPALAGSHE
ncbi:MAG TPA: histidine kinase [Longimicrobium sp.]|nr:histidine kinase [Longimicrobium sp.]